MWLVVLEWLGLGCGVAGLGVSASLLMYGYLSNKTATTK